MANYEKLLQAGVDVNGFLKRLMGNEILVKTFIKKFTEDKTFESLKLAFEEKDMKQAEMASHTLKGMCGNLSITELYVLFTEQVDLIRAGEYERAENMMKIITPKYDLSICYMQQWLANL